MLRPALSAALLAASALALAGCDKLPLSADKKKDEEPAGAAAGGFLSASDFKAGAKVKEYDKEKLQSHFTEDSDYEASPDDPDDTSKPDDAHCANDPTKGQKVKATADSLTIDYDVDSTKCEQEYNDQHPSDYTKVTLVSNKLRVRAVLRCTGADMTKYDGKTLEEIGKLDVKEDVCFDAGGTESGAYFNSKLVYHAKYEPKAATTGAKTTEFHVESIGATMTTGGDFCWKKKSGATITFDGCAKYSLSSDLSTDGEGDDLQTLTMSGLTYQTGDRYYRTGKIHVALNGWDGDVTYTGGTAAPTWTMTKGGKTESGKYEPKRKSQVDTQPATQPDATADQKDSADSALPSTGGSSASEEADSATLRLTGDAAGAALPGLAPAVLKALGLSAPR